MQGGIEGHQDVRTQTRLEGPAGWEEMEGAERESKGVDKAFWDALKPSTAMDVRGDLAT